MRFILGGSVVLVFAGLADVLRPKSFAGLLGAAPSVALATLTLTVAKHGTGYVATEARSMAIGAVAFALFSLFVCQSIMRLNWSAFAAAGSGLLVWLATAFGIEKILIG